VFDNAFGGIYLAKNLIIFASLSSNDVKGGRGYEGESGKRYHVKIKAKVGAAFAFCYRHRFL
jgi:hypothetical protein